MAKYDGKNMYFKYNAFVFPSGSLVSVEFPDTRDELDVTGAGQLDKEFLPSESSYTVTISAWDDVANTIYAGFPNKDPERAIEFAPQGITSGKPKKTATAFITSRNRGPVTHNQGVPFTVTLRVNGAITDTTYA